MKLVHFQTKRYIWYIFNLKTLEGIHKKNVIVLETSLLKNCGKGSSLSEKSRDLLPANKHKWTLFI